MIILYGASGHAKVICSVIEANEIAINGIFDDYSIAEKLGIYDILGGYDASKFIDNKIVIAIGSNKIRKELSLKIQHEYAVVIHPKSLIDKEVTIGEGSVLLHGVIIQRSVQIGKHVIVNTGAMIDHDCVISDFVHISPNATLCGNVRVHEGAQVGAGAVIIQGITIGENALVGAGAVVIKDVPPNCLVLGNPARTIKSI